jgi:beta-glucanase (GH16 family)
MRAILLLLALCLPPCLQAGDWKLVWSDEFQKDGLPDPAKWSYESGLVRNGEAQYYTVGRKENARVEGGRLIIEARKEEWQGSHYTSASIHSNGKASWTYGKMEVRAKLPGGRGMWPAAWMLGTNIGSAGWPGCGEIDIMEFVGFEPDTVFTTIHTKSFNHMKGTQKGAAFKLKAPDKGFHLYSVEWDPKAIEFFVDGKRSLRFENDGKGKDDWPFDAPQYLILNSAVGGGWGGQKGIDEKIFPTRYEIDYVRVYQK